MGAVPAALRKLVIERAAGRCEYCDLSQQGQEASFHIDHILPGSAGGPTSEDNLALACVSCSLRKAARLVAIDPATGEETPIFHPRTQKWNDHFQWDGTRVNGTTPTGRATVSALRMNRSLILAIRREEMQRNRHPPSI